MSHPGRSETLKRLLIAAVLSAVVVGIVWAVADIYGGTWRRIHARVVGRQFIPDRSHWRTFSHCSGTPSRCSTSMEYVSVPAEYHVFVAEMDGHPGDFNDAWAFSNLHEGQHCTVQARIGASGIRWFAHIPHEGVTP